MAPYRRFKETGFDFTFSLPYKAIDVFKEVCNLSKPLGADSPSLQYTVSDTTAKVRSASSPFSRVASL